jgi:uncharacterized protein (DUF58 family)
MLTVRSSFILAVATWALFIGLMERNEALALVCLSFILWIWMEWLWFQRLTLSTQSVLLGVSRAIDDQSDTQITMVTDRVYRVQLTGGLPSRTRGYRLLIQDSVPDTFEMVEGNPLLVIDSTGPTTFVLDYSVRSPMCGKLSFPGVQVEMSDYWGFFRAQQFLSLEQKPTVLPYLIRPQTTVSVLKHNNLQRHIGHHRHRSAGVSSELHGIRDYRVGDPPRTIAWKPTARLGKLMTREFENEVPIRATVIVDLASYQFQGRPGPAAADRAIMACASIAKLLLADRDPVAATLLHSNSNPRPGEEADSLSAQRIGHGSGERQLTRLLHHLLVASNPNPTLDHLQIEDLVKIVFENCSRRFPQLFDEHFNSGPVRRRLFRLGSGKSGQLRRSLAMVLESILRLDPGFSTRMQFDDEAMREVCLRYVKEYAVDSSSTTVALDQPWASVAVWRRECKRMTQFLCDHLLAAKSQAKDNELFVLIAPEPIDRQGIETLENAIKSVVAARHRVIFVAPWLPELTPSNQDPVAARIIAQTKMTGVEFQGQRPSGEFAVKRDPEVGSPVPPINTPYPVDHDLRFGLTALGATYSRIGDPKLMQIVAMEIGLLQSGKSRVKSLRAR